MGMGMGMRWACSPDRHHGIESSTMEAVFLFCRDCPPFPLQTAYCCISMFILTRFLSSTCVSPLTISPCKRGKSSPPGLFLDHTDETSQPTGLH